jgi:hypothetical protein
MKEKYLYGFAVVALLSLLLLGFTPETASILAGVFRGRERELNGCLISIPSGWYSPPASGQGVTMSQSRGRMRTLLFGDARNVLILFFPDSRLSSGNDYFNALDQRLRRYGTNMPSERFIAGTLNSCISHTPSSHPSEAFIYCFPKNQRGNIMVSYIGDTAHVPEFFAILDGVKKTN